MLRFLVQRSASKMYDALWFDSAHPCRSWVVEDEPHIPSYLYMAAKQECISPETTFLSAGGQNRRSPERFPSTEIRDRGILLETRRKGICFYSMHVYGLGKRPH